MRPQQHIEIRRNLQLKTYDDQLWLTLSTQLFLSAVVFFLCSLPDWKMNLLAIPFLTTLMIRSFAIMHEASHKSLTENLFINDLLGEIHGCICQLPFYPWKQSHLQHHKWSGNIQHDPVMAFLKIYPRLPLRTQKILTALWNSWIPVLAFVQQVVFWSVSIKMTRKNKNFRTMISLSLPLLFWGTMLFIAPLQITLLTFIPAVLLFYISIEVINFPHHLQIQTLSNEDHLPAREQDQTARSCQYPKFISKFIAMNFNLHCEHHMYPDVTWRELPRITAAFAKENYTHNLDGYFSWILKNRSKDLEQVFFGDAVENQTEPYPIKLIDSAS